MNRIVLLMFTLTVFVGCVSEEPPLDTNSNNSTNNVNNQTNVNNENNLNNQNNQNNSNNQTICSPDIVDCDVQCGMVDDGCGTLIDCGTCNCEAGVANVTTCGPCDLGGIVCEADETGDGTCEYADVLEGADCNAIVYVVPGADETNAVGTIASPFGDPNSAIIFAQMFDRDIIVVAEGTTNVPETISVDGDAGHVNILGGYNSSFERDRTIRPLFQVEQPSGAHFIDISQPVHVELIEIATTDAMPGEDVRALMLESVDGLTLEGVVIRAGNGADGVAGADGMNGQPGAEGNDGNNGNNNLVSAGACTGEYQSALGGAAVTRTCGNVTLTSGRGGVSEGLALQNNQLVCRTDAGEDGESTPDTIGGAAGDSPIFAADGEDGVAELPAADAALPGVGEDGLPGTAGNPGQSGAGGGGGFTAVNCQGSGGGGGGGGTGGCGGIGGGGGQRGGDSVAVWLLDVSNTTFVDVEAFVGNGGNGGDGGAGGLGGNGGNAGTGGMGFCGLQVQVIQGGDGGRGAAGQDAGNGTGGSGGSSYGAVLLGQNDNVDLDAVAFTLGQAGTGGMSAVGQSPDGLVSIIAP